MSSFVGKVAAIRYPKSLLLRFLKFFVRVNEIDMNDFALPLDRYRSFSEFFVREFEEGARPLGDGLVSPVDGELKAAGVLQPDGTFSIKGGTYTAEELLGEASRKFEASWLCQLYLSPRDYHRFHAPCDMEIACTYKIDGGLFPVNSFGERFVPGLFKRNARQIIMAETEFGMMAYVAVGALNVGSIQLSSLIEGQRVKKGEELGYFNLGSSVLIILENNPLANNCDADFSSQKVRLGESLENFFS